MHIPVRAVSGRVTDTAKSIHVLWGFVVLVASFISLFGHSVLELRIYEIFIDLYRLPAKGLYALLHWPPASLGVVEVSLVRDLTSVLLVTLAVTGLKLYRELDLYKARKAILLSDEQAAKEKLEEAQAESSDVGGSVSAGAMLGLALGGPLGALIGAAAGALAGFASVKGHEAETEAAARAAQDTHATVQTLLAENRRRVVSNTTSRLVFCLFVGLLMIGLDRAAPTLIDYLQKWDDKVMKTVDGVGRKLHASAVTDGPPPATGNESPNAPAEPAASSPQVAAVQPAAPTQPRPSPTAPARQAKPAREPKASPPIPLHFRIPTLPSTESEAAPMTRYVVSPQWIKRPTSEYITGHYPLAAMERGLQGRVGLDCAVTADGRLTDCRVTDEDPTGSKFGEATLEAASRYRMAPIDGAGQPVGGARVRIALRWQLGR